jgi:hypothetical protein
MKIPLKIEREPGWEPEGHHTVHWKSALPFFYNSRGWLVHRVRSAHTYIRHGETKHSVVHYLCGAIGSVSFGEFFADPPSNRLVCESCEFIARKRKLPSADELAGRHCHVGRIRVEQTCCREEKERN